MTVIELIKALAFCQNDAPVFITSPDKEDDYFLDNIRIESDSPREGTIIFLDTSQ